MKKEVYEEVKAKLIAYAAELGCTINFNGRGYYYEPELNQITVPARSKQSWIQCIGILHELGHRLQSKSRIPNENKQHQQCIIIELEYTAWVQAEIIARHMQLFQYVEFESIFFEEFTKHWLSYIRAIPTYSRAQIQYHIDQFEPRVVREKKPRVAMENS